MRNLTLFACLSVVILVIFPLSCKAESVADYGVAVSVVVEKETGLLSVSIRNATEGIFSIHMQTIESIQKEWVVTGVPEKEGRNEGKYTAFLGVSEETEISKNYSDRSVVLKPGEGIGISKPIHAASFWKDIIENGLKDYGIFSISCRPVIFTPDSKGNPVKTDVKFMFEPAVITKQEILKLEGERLEKELRAPFIAPVSEKNDGDEKEDIIYVPDSEKKVAIRSYLDRETGRLYFSVCNILQRPISIHMRTIEKPETNMEVLGTDSNNKDEPISEWYQFQRDIVFTTSRKRTVELDRTVVLEPFESITNSILIWEADFWEDLLKTGIGIKKKNLFQFRLWTSLYLTDKNGLTKVDEAQYEYNSASADSKTILKLEELRKKLDADKKGDTEKKLEKLIPEKAE